MYSFDLRHLVIVPNSICISVPFFRPHPYGRQGIRIPYAHIYQQSERALYFSINTPAFFT